MKTIAFFNNKGGVGKTMLAYHLAWSYSDLGLRVLVADLDPQANLSAMFLEESRLEELWPDGLHPDTILGAVNPILRGLGDIKLQHVEEVADSIALLVGDLGLSTFEDRLSQQWPLCLDRDEASFRVISAFYRIMLEACSRVSADIVLIDVGPNLGAINRSALLSADNIVIPLVPDLFSLQGLRNLGPTLRTWRSEWQDRLSRAPKTLSLSLPSGKMQPAGYVALQHSVRLNRPVSAYMKWIKRIPGEYRDSVLEIPSSDEVTVSDDPFCLAQLKHYHSLVPMAMEARKPIFHLKPADGALGAHLTAARLCGEDFKTLARAIAKAIDLPLS